MSYPFFVASATTEFIRRWRDGQGYLALPGVENAGLKSAAAMAAKSVILINMAISLWQVYLMTRKPESAKLTQLEPLDTNELAPAVEQLVLEPALSITENTTHRLEGVRKDMRS